MWKRLFFLIALNMSFPPMAAAESFSAQDLEALLEKSPKTHKPVKSVEELIPLLPQELRENFTFVYSSRSPFAESINPEFPRTILFSKDTRLVITFTGQPGKPGYNFLEYMAFEDSTASFKLAARQLPSEAGNSPHGISNVTSCTSCHGLDARPINDSYPLWPGFYGSVRDSFPNELGSTRAELDNYRKFLAGEAKRGVYRDLIFSSGTSVPPYVDPVNFDPAKAVGKLETFKYLPNARLGMGLTELNRKRIFRKLSASSYFIANEKKLLAELLGCGPSQVSKKDILKIKSFINAENKQRLVRLGVTAQDPINADNDMQELKFARAIAQLDWVAQQSHVSRSDWSMALEPNSLAFFDGILSGIYKKKDFYIKEDVIFETLRHLSIGEPALAPFFKPSPNYSEYGYPFGQRIDLGAAIKSCRFL